MQQPPESPTDENLLDAARSSRHHLYLALGANMGDPVETFRRAISMIDLSIGNVLAVSHYYVTAPLNPPELAETSQPNFLNAVVRCLCMRSLPEVLDHVLEIERSLGRNRALELRWGPRPIDIDILALDSQVHEDERLTVPHPEVANRDFVLYPLRDVSEGFIHPALQLNVDELIYHYHARGLPSLILDTAPRSTTLRC